MIISITRLRLNHFWYLPAFIKTSRACVMQAVANKNCVGGATFVGPGLTFWTATLWSDEKSMREYTKSGDHFKAYPLLAQWCSEAATGNVEANSVPEKNEILNLLRANPTFAPLKRPAKTHTQKRLPIKSPWLREVFKPR